MEIPSFLGYVLFEIIIEGCISCIKCTNSKNLPSHQRKGIERTYPVHIGKETPTREPGRDKKKENIKFTTPTLIDDSNRGGRWEDGTITEPIRKR